MSDFRRAIRDAARTKGTWISFAACFILSGVFIWTGKPAAQPIAFNHQKHIAQQLDCTDCHVGAQSGAHATLPDISICLNCHQTAVTKSPEEEKIRTAAATGKPLVWAQITQVPPHVYFSHRRHVQIAKLDCAQCHGDMKDATVPPKARFRRLNMSDCLNCHAQHGVNTDCNDCHR